MTVNFSLTTTTEEGSFTTGSTVVDAVSGLTGDEEAAFWDYLWFYHADVDTTTGNRVERTPETRRQTVRRWQRSVRRAEFIKMVRFLKQTRARAAEDTVNDFSGKGES